MITAEVTVVIPSYNHKDYIEERIDSILNQSYQNFHLILLDDASTDGSELVLKGYLKHPKVSHLIFNKNNSGSVFKQWIKGIELAKGDYIWIAESDDFSHKDFLMETVAILEQNEKFGFVFTDSTVIDQDNNIVNPVPFNTLSSLNPQIEDVTYYDKESMDTGRFLVNQLLVVNASSVVFRTQALQTIDKAFLSKLKNAGDLFTYLHVTFNWEIAFINKKLNYYRLHDTNTTKKNIKTGTVHLDRIKIVIHFFDQLVKLPDSFSFLKYFLRRHYLPALDYNHHEHLKYLLKQFKSHRMLDKSIFIELKIFALIGRIQHIKNRHWFRTKVKSKLKEI